jgi:hypothetical protein
MDGICSLLMLSFDQATDPTTSPSLPPSLLPFLPPLPLNSESSRSHAVFTVVLESREVDTVDGITRARCASFNLVDLAGSERQGQTGTCGGVGGWGGGGECVRAGG